MSSMNLSRMAFAGNTTLSACFAMKEMKPGLPRPVRPRQIADSSNDFECALQWVRSAQDRVDLTVQFRRKRSDQIQGQHLGPLQQSVVRPSND